MTNHHVTYGKELAYWEGEGFIYIPGYILNSPEPDVFYMLDTIVSTKSKFLLYRFSVRSDWSDFQGPYVSRCWVTGTLFTRNFRGDTTAQKRTWFRQQLMNHNNPMDTRRNLLRYFKTACNYRKKV